MKKKFIPVIGALLMICLLFASCLYGIKGSRKVVRSERQVGTFTSISASAGIEVILSQDSVVKIIVEADDNLQNNIKTEVLNDELKIYPEKRISSCASKKVYVTFKSIHTLDASSGADITSKTELKLTSLQISVSSGASVVMSLITNKLNVDSNSGGNIKLSGSTESFDVDGSSGSNIKAAEFLSKVCNAGASSGASLKVFASEKINAQASSGGNIKVSGNPKERNIQKSSGGDVSFK
jgi:hypothetical protein